MKICVDSDILIELLRNNPVTIEWLKKNEQNELCISQISLFELYKGAFSHMNSVGKLRKLERMLLQFSVLHVPNILYILSGKESARLKKEGFHLDMADVLIGVSTREHNCVLKTNNVKHFSRIAGLQLL